MTLINFVYYGNYWYIHSSGALTSLQKFHSISLKASELRLVKSGVNVPSRVAVPGKRSVVMGTSVLLASVHKEIVIVFSSVTESTYMQGAYILKLMLKKYCRHLTVS